jgi:hypothetical protein
MKKQFTREERRIAELAQRESFITERLTVMHDEMSMIMRTLNKVVLPRRSRRTVIPFPKMRSPK